MPYKAPDVPVPVWKILKKFIGQDLRYVSLPVILNIPLCAMQVVAESVMLGANILERAAAEEDRMKRYALSMIAMATNFSTSKLRKKKPFNPMLGETFEFVTEKFRYIGEKVRHIPDQI